MSQLASDAKISSAMAALGMTAPLPNLDDSQVLKAILVALGNVVPGGGGGTGDVVGPAASTDGAVVLWDGITGKLIKDSSAFITGSGTLAFGAGPFTLTVPATGTAALLGVAQTFTAAQTLALNGAASTPVLTFSGSPFSGGSGTTTTPQVMFSDNAYTVNNWNTGGTILGFAYSGAYGGEFLRANNGAGAILWYIDGNGFYSRSQEASDSTGLIYNGLVLNSAATIRWFPGPINTTPDTAIARVSAGLLKITDASSGYGSIDAGGYAVGGVGGTSFSGPITNITITNGIVISAS